MSDTCAVSILVPICNVQKYLRECLDSIIEQSLVDIQIICIDDGSTDLSPAILDEYRHKDPRIEVITKPNSGYGNSMNCGLDIARGKYIGIVESDDIASKTMFEDLFRLAEEHRVDVVKSNFYYHLSEQDTDDDALEENLRDCIYDQVFVPREQQAIFLTQPAIWSALYRRDFLVEHGIRFLETPGASFQDTSFNFKVFASAKRALATRNGYLHYRIDNDNSSVKSLKKVFCICDEYKEIWDFAAADLDIYGHLRYLIPQIQYGGYLWNLNRLTPALQHQFYEVFAEEFARMQREDLLKRDYFNEDAWNTVSEMLADTQAFFSRHYGPIEVEATWIARFEQASSSSFEKQLRAVLADMGTSDELVCLGSDAKVREAIERVRKEDARVFNDDDLFLNRSFGLMDPTRLRGKRTIFVEVGSSFSAHKGLGVQASDAAGLRACQLRSDDCRMAVCDTSVLLDGDPVLFLPLAASLMFAADAECCDVAGWQSWTDLLVSDPCSSKQFPEAVSAIASTISWITAHKEHFAFDYLRAMYDVLAQLWRHIQRAYAGFTYDEQLRIGTRPSPTALAALTVPSSSAAEAEPDVSIIIPVYNAALYLRECLESVVRQDVSSFEVVCVNDGSTDDSLTILEEFARNDGRVRVFSQVNGGAGSARNRGINEARGRYLAFIDPDDYYAADDVLSKAIKAADEHDALVCGGSFVAFLEGSKEIHSFKWDESVYTFHEEGFRSFVDDQFDYGWIRFVYRRSIFEDESIRFPETRWYEDPVFFVRVMEKVEQYYALPYEFYRYRMEHKTVTWDALKTRDMLDGIAHNMAFAAEHGMDVLYSYLFRRIERDYHDAIVENLDDPGVFLKMLAIQSEVDISKVTYVREQGTKAHVMIPLRELIEEKHDTAIVRVARKLEGSGAYRALQSVRRTL